VTGRAEAWVSLGTFCRDWVLVGGVWGPACAGLGASRGGCLVGWRELLVGGRAVPEPAGQRAIAVGVGG
jgi:hypothetical protein